IRNGPATVRTLFKSGLFITIFGETTSRQSSKHIPKYNMSLGFFIYGLFLMRNDFVKYKRFRMNSVCILPLSGDHLEFFILLLFVNNLISLLFREDYNMQVHKEEKSTDLIKFIQKRDGRVQDFDVQKIAQALFQAAQQLDQKYSLEDARKIAAKVESKVNKLTANEVENLITTDIDELVLEVLTQENT